MEPLAKSVLFHRAAGNYLHKNNRQLKYEAE